MPSPLEGGSRTLQAAHQGSKWWLEGLCLGHIWVAYIYILYIYIITTIFKFKSKLLINGFKCLALVLIRFGIISRVSRRGIVGEGSNMFFGRGWYPFDIPHRMDTYLSQNDSAPMEWLKNKGSMTWFWMIVPVHWVRWTWLARPIPVTLMARFVRRHALRCPKSNPWQRCTLLRPAGGCFRHDSGCEIVEIHHHMPIITSEDKPQYYMAYHKQICFFLMMYFRSITVETFWTRKESLQCDFGFRRCAEVLLFPAAAGGQHERLWSWNPSRSQGHDWPWSPSIGKNRELMYPRNMNYVVVWHHFHYEHGSFVFEQPSILDHVPSMWKYVRVNLEW